MGPEMPAQRLACARFRLHVPGLQAGSQKEREGVGGEVREREREAEGGSGGK